MDQQLVTGRMAHCVVDDLEAVQIRKYHADPATIAMGMFHRLAETIKKKTSIRQFRQGIKLGQVGEALLRCLAVNCGCENIRETLKKIDTAGREALWLGRIGSKDPIRSPRPRNKNICATAY